MRFSRSTRNRQAEARQRPFIVPRYPIDNDSSLGLSSTRKNIKIVVATLAVLILGTIILGKFLAH